MGFVDKIKFYEDDLGTFTSKVSKELLNEIPISNLDSKGVEGIRTKSYPSGVTVQDSLLNKPNWASKTAAWSKRMISTNQGAGDKLSDVVKKAQFLINGHVKNAEFLVNDLESQLSDATKGMKKDQRTERTNEILKEIQDALTTGKEKTIDERLSKSTLPDDIKATVGRMRKLVDGLTKKLQRDNVLVDEDLRAVLNENLGVYLTRSYAKHDISNYAETYKNYMNEKQYADVINFLRDKYGSTRIKKVGFEKVKDGIHITMTNPYGLRSVTKTVDNIDALEDILPSDTIEDLKAAFKYTNTGEVTLQRPSKNQTIFDFGVSDTEIESTIIPALLGDTGAVEKIALGRPINDMGVGSFETGILKKKQDIDEPLRILMGEYTDPKVNFVKSVTRMASLLEKGKLANDLLEAGEGVFFTEKRTPTNTVQMEKPLFGAEPKKMFYTTPEIKELLSPTSITKNEGLQALIFLNSLTKAALTIAKDDSQARNFLGAAFNIAASGNMPKYLDVATQVAFSDASKSQKYASFMSTPLALKLAASSVLNRVDKEQIKELHIDAVRRGIIGESPTVGILNDLVETIKESKDPSSKWAKIKKGHEGAINTVAKPYEASDDIFKLSQYFQEIDRFKKIYPEKTENEIRDIAAGKVRAMQPVYSISSKAAKALSKSPFVGSFVMFSSQMYRTRANIISE